MSKKTPTLQELLHSEEEKLFEQIDEMKKLAGSYEALFSRVALKYRLLGLNEMIYV